MDNLLYGAAYYDEYMPTDRMDQDIKMMKNAGISVVRIGESTWSTLEPQDNVFNFSSLDKVLDAMHSAGIKVIVGTPTYAVPAWLVKKYPDILAQTSTGRNRYGPRQNMDITNPDFLIHAERVIRAMLGRVCKHPGVIGYQADNETKHYNNFGVSVQAAFVKFVKEKFKTLDNLNSAMGLDYWSNRINSWEEFPLVEGSINASLSCEYMKYQRKLVTDYLAWQVSLINEYKKENQFVTHNFDFEWRGYSFGVQPDVNHFEASKPFDVVGIDVYHPSQDQLTGAEISFCGDLARSLKKKNYLVMETQAQGFPEWVPYPGQLRLQAFSHFACGANMVEYWHWHSIHNSFETYWKGLLSHDLGPNPTYNEAKTIGADIKRIGKSLVNLKKENHFALVVSNEALSAFNSFKHILGITYNDVVRRMYDALYELNLECDFITPYEGDLSAYKAVFVPALYAVPNDFLNKLNAYVEEGGCLVASLQTGFSDENVKVRHELQPGMLGKVCGIQYTQFVKIPKLAFKDDPFMVGPVQNTCEGWIELLQPQTAEVLARYDHTYWSEYAAVTLNSYGKGNGAYIGCCPSLKNMKGAIKKILLTSKVLLEESFDFDSIIQKNGINQLGHKVHYFFNFSNEKRYMKYPFSKGKELLSNAQILENTIHELEPWGVRILEEM